MGKIYLNITRVHVKSWTKILSNGKRSWHDDQKIITIFERDHFHYRENWRVLWGKRFPNIIANLEKKPLSIWLCNNIINQTLEFSHWTARKAHETNHSKIKFTHGIHNIFVFDGCLFWKQFLWGSHGVHKSSHGISLLHIELLSYSANACGDTLWASATPQIVSALTN